MISVDAERSIIQVDVNLTKHVKDLEGKLDLFVQGVVSTLFNEVQERTPVDTGFARANWQGGLFGLIPTPAISASAAKANPEAGRAAAQRRQQENQATVVQVARAGAVLELSNNAEYIQALEDGWSQKAPEGMVKVTLLNAQQTVDEVAAHVMTMR